MIKLPKIVFRQLNILYNIDNIIYFCNSVTLCEKNYSTLMKGQAMADSRIPELLADLEAQACACLLSVAPVNKTTAQKISRQLANHLVANWRGQIIYFPRNHGGILDERDQQIYADFNGKNHQQLAKKYDIAVQQIYQIVKRVRQAEMAKRQIGLFDD